jgi:oxygen-dependent protoporphyrinogen oxidase
LRTFLGGAGRPEAIKLPDAEIRRLVLRELKELLGAAGEPELIQIHRWPRSMPQYHVGHLDRLARIDQRLAAHPRLALAGSAYRGVGVPQCIAGGERAAETVLAMFERAQASRCDPGALASGRPPGTGGAESV